MKARVKATGDIVEVKEEYDLRNAWVEVFYSNEEDPYEVYEKEELDFNIDGKFAENCLNGIKQGVDYNPDYWTRLEHQAAIAAMQGILSMPVYGSNGSEIDQDAVIECAMEYAHALVEKLKESK